MLNAFVFLHAHLKSQKDTGPSIQSPLNFVPTSLALVLPTRIVNWDSVAMTGVMLVSVEDI